MARPWPSAVRARHSRWESSVTATEPRISRHPKEGRAANRGVLMRIIHDVGERKHVEQRAREALKRWASERTAEPKAAQELLLAGNIEISSVEGQGTRALVTLPLMR